MTDKPYTTREATWRGQRSGWYVTSRALGDGVPEEPCLVVTGDLDAARRRLATPPTLPSFRKVAGTCPACSGSTLMLGAGDHVTCSWIGCPDPMAARRRLDPPAVSDDTRTSAIDVILADLRHGGGHGVVTPEQAVDALAAAGLLGPSHLDRLAAWAAARPGGRIHVYRYVSESVAVEAYDGRELHDEIDADAQEAARRVLARMEASDA